jgi:hypothetical protein
MTTLDSNVSIPRPRAVSRALRLAPWLYAGTIFLSALLLFALQPMFAKMVLPKLGGAPTVWSVAMVFFQGALLAGYAYAHLLTRCLRPGPGALIHLAVLAAAAMTLPIGIAHSFGSPPSAGIELWLIALFAASIGLPFAVLSASAPLLQGWFGATDHPQARNPYVLYAASNLGSFAALMAYPALVEPLLPVKDQAALWAMGFALLAVLVTAASLFITRRSSAFAGIDRVSAPPVQDRLRWMMLSAIPAGLVIAVTSYVTTDIAAAPFLWVLPLALYLLTFVAAFRDRPWLRDGTVARLVPILVAPLAISLLGGDRVFWLAMAGVNLAAFFLLALLCHGELYRRRPTPARLTEFYLWVSLGGVIGGVFAALIAPHVFSRIYEYPILIAAAVLALPGMFAGGMRRMLAEAGPVLALAALVLVIGLVLDIRLPAAAELPVQIALVALAAVMLLQRKRPARFFALVVLAFVVTEQWQPGFNRIESARSFFGVHQVVDTADGRHRLLYHGTTLHGAERIGDRDAAGTGRPEPLTYFYFGGPISQSIEAVRAARGGLARVAVVGLGTGSLACHKRDHEDWTFFEIDPDVVRIARDPRLFTFLSVCAPALPVIVGDARLTLSASPQLYDLIVLDAFSSDAIPVHLLTREALTGYLARLQPGGALVLHISNRHMELGSVVAAVAAGEGLVTYLREDDRPDTALTDYKMNALVAALARRSADLGALPNTAGWREIKPDAHIAAWTDDYSDLVGAILRKKLAR